MKSGQKREGKKKVDYAALASPFMRIPRMEVAAARACERKSFAAPSARHAPESAKTKSIANAAKNVFIAVENRAYFLVSNWKTVRVL